LLPIKKNIRIVHITDIHYDVVGFPRISDALLDQLVIQCNAAQPDLILLTGDYVEYTADACKILCDRWLSKLKSKYGIYAVLGNHDYKQGEKGKESIVRSLTNIGIRVLQSELVYPIPEQKNLELIGVGDSSSKLGDFRIDDAFSKSSSSAIKIMLSHNPDTAYRIAAHNVDLQLSGHFHGGQVCLPWGKYQPILKYLKMFYSICPAFIQKIFPPQIHVAKNWDRAKGYFKIDENQRRNLIYVNRGLATHPPLRFFCSPEIAIIDLLPQ